MYPWRLRGEDSQSGETLVEVIVALVILAGAVFLLVQGIASVVAMGTARQNQATVTAVARSIAEAVDSVGANSAITACNSTNATTLANAVAGVPKPSNVTVGTVTVAQGTFSSGSLSFSGNCSTTSPPGTDTGVLQVSVTITASGVSANSTAATSQFSQSVAVVIGSPRG